MDSTDQNWTEFWKNRWQTGQIGWHQDEVEPALSHYFSKRGRGPVFVPLCGKSLDMQWLSQNGFNVFGVELSLTGILDYFELIKTPFEVQDLGSVKVYRAKGVSILNADILRVTSQEWGLFFNQNQIKAVYDRAALIALPPQLRESYAKLMIDILSHYSDPKDLDFLQIILWREPVDFQGPPFSVSEAMLEELYAESFNVKALGQELVPAKSPSQKMWEGDYDLKFK